MMVISVIAFYVIIGINTITCVISSRSQRLISQFFTLVYGYHTLFVYLGDIHFIFYKPLYMANFEAAFNHLSSL